MSEESSVSESDVSEGEEKKRGRPKGSYGMRKETRRKLVEVARLIASGVPVRQAIKQVGLSGDSYTKYRSYIKQLVKKFREGIEEAEVARELKQSPPEPSELEEAEAIISQYMDRQDLPPDLAQPLQQIRSAISFFDEVERLKYQVARKLLGSPLGRPAPSSPPSEEKEEKEEPKKPFDFNEVLKTVEEMERAAKEFLERRGYKVLPPGSPSNVDEAKKLLESYGYRVQRDCVPLEKVKEMIQIAREEGYREGYEAAKKEFSEQESEWKVQQLKVAETLLGRVIDRVMGPFEYLIAKYFGIDYYPYTSSLGVGYGVGSQFGSPSFGGGSADIVSAVEELARKEKREKRGSGEESEGGGEGGE